MIVRRSSLFIIDLLSGINLILIPPQKYTSTNPNPISQLLYNKVLLTKIRITVPVLVSERTKCCDVTYWVKNLLVRLHLYGSISCFRNKTKGLVFLIILCLLYCFEGKKETWCTSVRVFVIVSAVADYQMSAINASPTEHSKSNPCCFAC